jgi:hypothetical protein
MKADIDDLNQEFSAERYAKTNIKMSMPVEIIDDNENFPCLIHLDSLSIHKTSEIGTKIAQYIWHEHKSCNNNNNNNNNRNLIDENDNYNMDEFIANNLAISCVVNSS